jgi:hypothetical protein
MVWSVKNNRKNEARQKALQRDTRKNWEKYTHIRKKGKENLQR